jgi:hypothetical protein
MRKKAEVLADINAGIPPGVDWLAGAKRYVEAVFERNDRPAIAASKRRSSTNTISRTHFSFCSSLAEPA